MGFVFTTQIVETPSAELSDVDAASGEDISLVGGDYSITPAGDLSAVIGKDAARQSILRELPAPQGALARRPEWGEGLSGLLFKGASQTSRERAESRSRARLLANPRVTRVNSVAAGLTESGISLSVDVDTVGGRLEARVQIKPPGVK